MRLRIRLALVLLAAVLLWTPTAARSHLPSTLIQIKGTQNGDDGVTATFRAFRNGTDPFRVVCSEPCAADLDAIDGLYAGFATVRQQIVALFGVAPVLAAQPFDIHIDADHWCGPEQPGIGGDSQQYSEFLYSGVTTGSYGCFWFTTPGHYALPFHYPETSTPQYHLLTAHEFTHTMFFQRHFWSYEDFAKAISFYITDPNTGIPVTDPCDDRLNFPGNGKMLWAMCHLNGFQYSQLSAPFAALDALYQSGQGTATGMSTSPYQWHQEFNSALGSNVMDAMLTSKQTELPQIGDRATLPYGGGRARLLGGWLQFLVSVNALTADQPILVDGSYSFNGTPPGNFNFQNVYRVSRPNLTDKIFEDSIYVQAKYDPTLLPAGTDQSSLRFYKTNGNGTFAPLADSRVDPARMIVSGSITSTGLLILVGAPTTAPDTQVIPRALSNPEVHTRAVLRNPSFSTITGTLTLHAQGVSASPSDPSLPYSLAYNKTLVLDDLVAAFGATGGATVDVTPSPGTARPDVYVVDVDTFGSGFPGSTLQAYPATAALTSGQRAMLVGPGNVNQENLAFVIRTFAAGATFTVVTRDASGTIVASTPISYAPNRMTRVAATTFTGGAALVAGSSFEFVGSAGGALILSEMRGDGTRARDLRLADRYDLAASAEGDTLDLPKAVLQTNPNATTLRTALQLNNPGPATITGKVRFKPAGGGAISALNYSIAAGATRTYADIVGALNQTGGGALEVVSTGGHLPLAFARVIYSGTATPWEVAAEAAHDSMDRLQAGDRTVLLAPTSVGQEFRIGVRTLQKALNVTITINTADGFQISKLTRSFAAAAAFEDTAANLFGVNLTAGQVVEIFVDGGNGVIYGSTANPATGAVSYQSARRLPYY